MSKPPKHYISNIPELMAEWNWEKNNKLELDPSKLTHGSKQKAWWKCNKGHEWVTAIKYRTLKHSGCPECAKYNRIIHRPTSISNIQYLSTHSLAVRRPDIAKEWHPTKNGDLIPSDVTEFSNKKVWWKCERGHEWEGYISSRTKKGRQPGCPYCNHVGMSYSELILYYYIQKHTHHEVKHRFKIEGVEFDIYIPKIKIAIEYDGSRYHNTKQQYELYKNHIAIKNNITLYRIRELPLAPLNDTSIDLIYHPSSMRAFEQVISDLIKRMFQKTTIIDFSKDNMALSKFQKCVNRQRSLATINPTLAAQWHPTKNGDLKPEHVPPYSMQRIWWQCKYGHEWDETIASRSRGFGCPICSNHRVLSGFNDLATINPTLAAQWHPTKNGDLKPTSVLPYSRLKAWWQCSKCGSEWESQIANRSCGTGCPNCAKLRKTIT